MGFAKITRGKGKVKPKGDLERDQLVLLKILYPHTCATCDNLWRCHRETWRNRLPYLEGDKTWGSTCRRWK